ncbi:MAG: hypothetical protein V3S11_05295, partial [Elusimicrobiota bacterium]
MRRVGRAVLFACLIFAAPAPVLAVERAFESFPTSLHIAAFRRTHFELSLPILEPFERMLQNGGTDFVLLRVENLPSHFNGEEYTYRLPERFLSIIAQSGLFEEKDEGAGPERVELQVIETGGGYFAFVPPDPELMGRLLALVRDRKGYHHGRVPRSRLSRASLIRTSLADGSEIHALKIRSADEVRYPQWRSTVALVYKIRYRGREADALFLYKTLGGEGRLASALEGLREQYGPELLVLNRGEIFVGGATKTTGTLAGYRFEGMGVQASVVGAGELVRLKDLFAYRSERGAGEGVHFLSANLVYSSDTARSLLPTHRIFQVEGKRVAVLGLTRSAYGKFLVAEESELYTVKDAIATAREWVPQLREEADVILVLSNLSISGNEKLKRRVPGIDLIIGNSFQFRTDSALPTTHRSDPERDPSQIALLITADWPSVLSHVEVEHRSLGGEHYSLSAREEHILLDESFPDREGYPKFNPLGYGVSADTGPPLLPAARRLYLGVQAAGIARLKSRDFWSLGASLAAESLGAEAAFVPVWGIRQLTTGDYRESLVRDWFRRQDRFVVFQLPGSALSALIAEVRRQEGGGSIPSGGLRMAVGGVGAGDTIHGVAVEAKALYRVAATRRLLALDRQYPAFGGASRPKSNAPVDKVILSRLRSAAREGWPAERYRPLLEGRPLRERGLWRVNFRDVSLNVSNTKVVSDDAFDSVPNARVNGFDELLIGSALKTDVEYLRGPLKWANILEAEYSKSRLSPPGQQVILNTPQNRLSFRTVGTHRIGSFPWHWAAKSYGPSFGVEYEGHVERVPLQRRKHIVSVLPGVEFYGGSFLSSVEISGNLRRDFTPRTPVNQYGFRMRSIFGKSLGKSRFSGDLWANFFIKTPQDTSQDLKFEANAKIKLSLPLYKSFSLAPFIDFYYFVLKTR